MPHATFLGGGVGGLSSSSLFVVYAVFLQKYVRDRPYSSSTSLHTLFFFLSTSEIGHTELGLILIFTLSESISYISKHLKERK